MEMAKIQHSRVDLKVNTRTMSIFQFEQIQTLAPIGGLHLTV